MSVDVHNMNNDAANAGTTLGLPERMAARLRDRLLELGREIRSISEERSEAPLGSVAGTGDTAGTPGDQGDQAEQRSRQVLRDAEAMRDQAEARDIEAALDRIRLGSYGECTDCGNTIDLRRLEVQPAAARCLPCQERDEQVQAMTQRTSLWS